MNDLCKATCLTQLCSKQILQDNKQLPPKYRPSVFSKQEFIMTDI